MRDSMRMRVVAVRTYLSLSPLGAREKRDLYDEVLDLFLCAQADGKEPGTITGKDPAAFAKGVLAAFGAEKPIGARWLPESLMYFIGFAAGTQALLSLESPGGRPDHEKRRAGGRHARCPPAGSVRRYSGQSAGFRDWRSRYSAKIGDFKFHAHAHPDH